MNAFVVFILQCKLPFNHSFSFEGSVNMDTIMLGQQFHDGISLTNSKLNTETLAAVYVLGTSADSRFLKFAIIINFVASG